MRTTTRRGAGLLLTLPLLLAGCAHTPFGGGMTPEEQLRARPSYQQASRDYLTMLTEMRTATSKLVPTIRWEGTPNRVSQAACEPPFTDLPGTIHTTFDAGTGKGGIPDADWPAVTQALVKIAARYGFAAPETVVSTPGRHYLVIHDSWNGTIRLGSEANATISVSSPCLLTDTAPSTSTSTSTPTST